MSELALILAMLFTPGAHGRQPAAEAPKADEVTQAAAKQNQPKPKMQAAKLDRSGKAKKGKASYYSARFTGKKMANGAKMDPQASAAASRTLPLGTTARVTNLENGRSADVEITDRGPYVAGRTVDVTPKVANDLGMKEKGTAVVEVAPLAIPQADGSMKAGDASASIGSSLSTPVAAETAR